MTRDELIQRSKALHELERVRGCIFPQHAFVRFQSPSMTDVDVRIVNNIPYCTDTESLADKIFRPAIQMALEEYRKALINIANVDD